MLALGLSVFVLAGRAVGSYAPEYIACPTDGTGLRLSGVANVNQTLNPLESAYTQQRKQVADAALLDWITRNDLVNVVFGNNSESPVSPSTLQLPKLALSASGGGFRASVVGAAWLHVLDGRNTTSGSDLGGLLQSATYLSGLSGGSLLLASVILNEMPDLYNLVQGPPNNGTTGSWNLDLDLLQPGSGAQPLQYLQTVLGDVGDKRSAGEFNVTLVDVFARGLSYHFVPGTSPSNFFSNSSDHGASITWSSAKNLTSWLNHTLPFPIIAIQSYSVNAEFNPSAFAPGITLSNTNYEATPVEFGSFDGKLATFVATEYLGTPLNGGRVTTPDGQCVKNFDNAGFIIGCSSNIFPSGNRTGEAGLLALNDPSSPIAILLNVFNSTFGGDQPAQQLDVGAVANPFKGLRVGEYEDADQDQLRLVDGGFGGEGAPVSPLLVKPRQVDVIIVMDSSDNNNVTGAPSGGTLIATQVRSQILGRDVLSIPPLPSNLMTYEQQNLTRHPVFYGCRNDSTLAAQWPLIIYVPNYDVMGITNSSTLELSYTKAQSGAIFERATEIFATGKPGARHEWVECVACAILDGVRRQSGIQMSRICSECFQDYCWSGNESPAQGGTSQGGNSTVPGTGNGGESRSGSEPGNNATDPGNSGSGSGGQPVNAGSIVTAQIIGIVATTAMAIARVWFDLSPLGSFRDAMIGPLLRAQLTAMLTKKLLESPAFHRLVGATHSSIDKLQQSAYDSLARAVAEGEAKMPPAAQQQVYRNASFNADNHGRPSTDESARYSTQSAHRQQPPQRPSWKERPARDTEAEQKPKKEMERRQQELQALLSKLKQPPPSSP
ncbi:hypothetical protein OIV83_002338 [Microbotryomycetes sp. JL201]|nr:hypothetical protein OIV83_002338 [Microbotryomycetes sp. JL201]